MGKMFILTKTHYSSLVHLPKLMNKYHHINCKIQHPTNQPQITTTTWYIILVDKAKKKKKKARSREISKG